MMVRLLNDMNNMLATIDTNSLDEDDESAIAYEQGSWNLPQVQGFQHR